MVQINFGQREVSCKVVFYGPGMSGKTTNLEIIHKKAPKEAVGEMVSIATETDRTLYFDFLPLDLGQVAGMRTKFQLYTVPGQIYYNATRKLVLQGCDGVIFVADSAPDKMAENLESLQNLRDNLAEMGLTIDDPANPGFVPVILQYNKRDLPNALSVADMNAQMNPLNFPIYEACARDGKGVFATLKEASRLVIERLNKEHAPGSRGRRTGTSLPQQPPAAQTPTPAHSAVPAPPAAPTPPRPTPQLPARPLPGAGATHTPSGGNPIVRPPAPPPPAPPRPPAPPPRPAYNPAGATPAMGVPTHEPASPREKHLQKAKPPALGVRGPGGPDLGATDPNLKKFQQHSGGSSGVKTMLIVLIFVLIAAVLLVLLTLFVPAVRALLPIGMQQKIETMVGGPPASQPAAATAPSAPTTTPTVPATVPAAPATAPTAPATTTPATPAAPNMAPTAASPTPAPATDIQPAAPAPAVAPAPVETHGAH
jgi:signal recognition particle receptor subunit beta